VTVAGLSACFSIVSSSAYMLADSVLGSMPSKYTLGCTVNTLLFSREVPVRQQHVVTLEQHGCCLITWPT
jgi:hypothetical protein